MEALEAGENIMEAHEAASLIPDPYEDPATALKVYSSIQTASLARVQI